MNTTKPKTSTPRRTTTTAAVKTRKPDAPAVVSVPIAIRTEGLSLSSADEAYVRQRMSSKLRKFADRITRVSVRFELVSGDRKSESVVCRIKTVLPNLASVLVESPHGSVRSAFDETADAHDRAVRRLLDKKGRSARPRA